MAESGPAATGRIFVSYRREETAYPAGWLFDRETQENSPGDGCNTVPESDLAELRAVLVFLNGQGSYRVDNVRVD